MKRRICLYGGAGVGKTTVATYIFSELKVKDYKIEYVPEPVKFWTYINKSPAGFDPIYLISKRIYKIDTIMRGSRYYH